MNYSVPFCGSQRDITPPWVEGEHQDFLKHFHIQWITSPAPSHVVFKGINQKNFRFKGPNHTPLQFEVTTTNNVDLKGIDVSKWKVDEEIWIGNGDDLMEQWREIDKTKIKATYVLKRETQKDGEWSLLYEITVGYDIDHFVNEGYRRNSFMNNQVRIKVNVTMHGINESGLPPKIFLWSPAFSVYSHKSVMERTNKKSKCKETKSNTVVYERPLSPLVSDLFYGDEDESANTSTTTTTTTTTQSSEKLAESSMNVDTKKKKQSKQKIQETSNTILTDQTIELMQDTLELKRKTGENLTPLTSFTSKDSSVEIYVFKVKVSKKNPE